jgi:hypothetical protein
MVLSIKPNPRKGTMLVQKYARSCRDVGDGWGGVMACVDIIFRCCCMRFPVRVAMAVKEEEGLCLVTCSARPRIGRAHNADRIILFACSRICRFVTVLISLKKWCHARIIESLSRIGNAISKFRIIRLLKIDHIRNSNTPSEARQNESLDYW